MLQILFKGEYNSREKSIQGIMVDLFLAAMAFGDSKTLYWVLTLQVGTVAMQGIICQAFPWHLFDWLDRSGIINFTLIIEVHFGCLLRIAIQNKINNEAFHYKQKHASNVTRNVKLNVTAHPESMRSICQ